MNKIYFSEKLNQKFLGLLKEELKEVFSGCKRIVIKIHFGEPRNNLAFKPEEIKPIVLVLKELGIEFFFYDTSVAYHSVRNNSLSHKAWALAKGWGKLGEVNTEDSFVKVKGAKMDYEVAKPLVEADGVLVLSHFKGHYCSGFGGAIKNLGMGALSKKSKSNIHSGGEPVIFGKCIECGDCEKNCPINGIKVEKDGPHIKNCYGCSNCIYSCKNNVLKPKLDFFDFLLADGANAAQSKFKKFYYISYVINLAKHCDCEANPKGKIAEDVGFLHGSDAVAIDMAARDLIFKKEGEDVFLKHNKKSGLEQVKAAEKLGMGSSEYTLVD